MPNNRREPAQSGAGFELTELADGCSLKVYAVMPERDLDYSRGDISYDEVHVWWTNIDKPFNGAWIEDVLDSVELHRAQRFVRASDHRRFVTARACLRFLIGHYTGVAPREVRFSYGAHGKPTLDGSWGETDLCFNLSHTQDLLLYAFARGRAVGVDLECVREDIDVERLVPLVFSNQDLDGARCRASDVSRDAFFRTWVAKEAYVKATGLGLAMDLTRLHIEWANCEMGRSIDVLDKPEEQQRWSLRMLPAPSGYLAALVVEAGQNDFPSKMRLSNLRFQGCGTAVESSLRSNR